MSKKWTLLLTVICIGLAVFVFFSRLNQDKEAPVISFSDKTVSLYRSDMNNTELLTGVSASDTQDGDVSASLTVESVYTADETHVIITYAAKDSSNNITKQKREIEIDPDFINEDPVEADDVEETSDTEEDEDTTTDPKEQTTESEQADITPTPVPAKDEAQEVREAQEAEADAMPAQNPRVYLTDYLVKIPIGTSFDSLSYVKEIQDDTDDVYALWRKVQISGEVNSSVPGTYTCTYYVIDSQNNISNNAVLTVIVE